MYYNSPAREARLEMLRRELRADLVANPDERLAIPQRGYEWATGLKPRDLFAAWLVDQTAVNGLRIDRLQRVERRRRLRRSIRAACFWEEDRRVEAERVASHLASDPGAVKFALEQTPQGCDWMIVRWKHLLAMAGTPTGWDDRDRGLAANLLAAPMDLRPRDPLAWCAEPAAVAGREIARLEAIRDGVVGDIDDFDRSNAEADLQHDPSAEGREIRRELASLQGRLRWCLKQIKTPVAGPGCTQDFRERCFPLPQPESPYPLIPPAPAAPEPSPPAEAVAPPQVEPEPEPEPEPGSEAEVILPLAPPIPKVLPSRRHRRASQAVARQAGRRLDPCPS